MQNNLNSSVFIHCSVIKVDLYVEVRTKWMKTTDITIQVPLDDRYGNSLLNALLEISVTHPYRVS